MDLRQDILKPATLLAGFALLGAVALYTVFHLTKTRIEENERKLMLERFSTLVVHSRYDNDPLTDQAAIPAAALGSSEPVVVYRARKQGQPVAAIFQTTTPNGYSGNIRLIVAVNADHTLAGVRAISHKETPGLGDKVDAAKSGWIQGFSGKSIGNPPLAGWAVRKDGGEFDQFSGATITPRAVVNMTKAVLLWSDQHLDGLFAQPTTPQEQAHG